MKGLIQLLALLSMIYQNRAETAKAYTIMNSNTLNFMVNGTGKCSFTVPSTDPASNGYILLAFDKEIQGNCTLSEVIKVYGTKPYECSFGTATPTLASLYSGTTFIVECEGDITARGFVVPGL
jgi:hypothetical protein